MTFQSNVKWVRVISTPGLPHPPPPGTGSAGLMGKHLIISLVRETPGGHGWNQTPWTGLRNLSCTFGESLCWFLLSFQPVPGVQESRTCTEAYPEEFSLIFSVINGWSPLKTVNCYTAMLYRPRSSSCSTARVLPAAHKQTPGSTQF